MTNPIPTSIYGPVKSWRLGLSLGVDMLCVDSICSFECVYCQLGKINQATAERGIFISTERILEDLYKTVWHDVEAITFSGSGEPTLAENLGEAIAKIKEITQKPIVVLTNSSLLNQKTVRDELRLADKIFCKLDAWSDDILKKINRSVADVPLEAIISGIRLLRNEFRGFLAIQTMILRSPSDFELEKFAEILLSIQPDEVQLNLPIRPVPHDYFVENRGNALSTLQSVKTLKTISKEELESIRTRLFDLTKIPSVSR